MPGAGPSRPSAGATGASTRAPSRRSARRRPRPRARRARSRRCARGSRRASCSSAARGSRRWSCSRARPRCSRARTRATDGSSGLRSWPPAGARRRSRPGAGRAKGKPPRTGSARSAGRAASARWASSSAPSRSLVEADRARGGGPRARARRAGRARRRLLRGRRRGRAPRAARRARRRRSTARRSSSRRDHEARAARALPLAPLQLDAPSRSAARDPRRAPRACSPHSIEGLHRGGLRPTSTTGSWSTRARAPRRARRSSRPARRDVRTLRGGAGLGRAPPRGLRSAILDELAAEDPRRRDARARGRRATCASSTASPRRCRSCERAVERDPRDCRGLDAARARAGQHRRRGAARARASSARTRSRAGRAERLARQHARSCSSAWRETHGARDARRAHASPGSPTRRACCATYLVPFYARRAQELAARYGFTPGPTHDRGLRPPRATSRCARRASRASRRSGVCFGPVVTAVSPLSRAARHASRGRARRSTSSRTSIHLGLSHNRCPRWITEGLATWEEEQRNPAWTRNMRRELARRARQRRRSSPCAS